MWVNIMPECYDCDGKITEYSALRPTCIWNASRKTAYPIPPLQEAMLFCILR